MYVSLYMNMGSLKTNVGFQFLTHLCLLKQFELMCVLTYKTLTVLVQAKLFYIFIFNVALPQAYAQSIFCSYIALEVILT